MFDPGCTLCPRLADYLAQLKNEYPAYHAAPVGPFGDAAAKLLIVGLAPGMHGANATGRPFTGDASGKLLFEALFRYGFSSSPSSLSVDDGLQLKGCRITNAVKCLPPQNRPLTSEINQCNRFLVSEIETLGEGAVIMALGSIAHTAILKSLGLKQGAFKFSHNRLHKLPTGHYLVDSYHCSRYNIQTRRLTDKMFYAVFARSRDLIDGEQ
ncbi:MAG: uracil-DNA glycosylase [Sedimenticola sp.]